MSAFDDHTKNLPVAPLKTVVLRDHHWASTFGDKPANPIQVGLRLLSIDDKDVVRQVASKAAADAISQDLDPQIAAHKAMLITTVARAICSPKDVKRGHDFFQCADDMLQIALTEESLKWLFDELESLTVSFSPVFSEATPDEIAELCADLADGALDRLAETDPTRAARVRRYLDFVITELETDAS